MKIERADVVIVGAGPAGLAAAEVLASERLHVMVVDEQPAAGGQILRQPPPGLRVKNWLPGRSYSEQKALLRRVTAIRSINWKLGTTVLGLEEVATENGAQQLQLLTTSARESGLLTGAAVLIAAGCYDAPVCFPGWTLPGCMATGGIQAFVKSQQVLPGERFLFVGSHPLQLIVADQVLRNGGTVQGVVFPQHRSDVARLLMPAPSILRCAWPRFVDAARALWRLRRAGVPIFFGETVLRAEGNGALEAVTLARVDRSGKLARARSQQIACDRLGVCFRFLAASELLRQAGAAHRWSALEGGWVAVVDEWFRTTRPNLYGAGEVTGVAGADAAMLEGAIAGYAILRDLEGISARVAARKVRSLRRRHAAEQRFAEYLRSLSATSDALLVEMLTDETVICKCQNITLKHMRVTLKDNPHIGDLNALKLISRTGMGLCQGRYCGLHARMILMQSMRARACLPFTAQMPVKPVLIADLLSGADSDAR